MGEKHFKPHPQNRILVLLRDSFQNFRQAPPSFSYGGPPGVYGLNSMIFVSQARVMSNSEKARNFISVTRS